MPKLQTCLSDIEWDPKYGASRIPFRLFCQHWVLAVGRTRDRLKFFFRKKQFVHYVQAKACILFIAGRCYISPESTCHCSCIFSTHLQLYTSISALTILSGP